MPTSPLREHTLTHVRHPDPLRDHLGVERVLVDDEVTRRIQQGDPVLGWEGDARIGLYVNRQTHAWEAWRCERDGTYRLVATADATTVRAFDVVPKLILRLIAHDTRRGYDVAADVNAVNAAVEREHERQRVERTEEFADKLGHALTKDGVD